MTRSKALAAVPYPRLQHLFVYEDAAALPAYEIAVGNQMLVGADSRIARQIKLPCEFATGWQLHAGWKGAVEYALNKFLPNLLLQIHRLIGVDIDNRVGHERCAGLTQLLKVGQDSSVSF
jgi:hypothetical protein